MQAVAQNKLLSLAIIAAYRGPRLRITTSGNTLDWNTDEFSRRNRNRDAPKMIIEFTTINYGRVLTYRTP